MWDVYLAFGIFSCSDSNNFYWLSCTCSSHLNNLYWLSCTCFLHLNNVHWLSCACFFTYRLLMLFQRNGWRSWSILVNYLCCKVSAWRSHNCMNKPLELRGTFFFWFVGWLNAFTLTVWHYCYFYMYFICVYVALFAVRWRNEWLK